MDINWDLEITLEDIEEIMKIKEEQQMNQQNIGTVKGIFIDGTVTIGKEYDSGANLMKNSQFEKFCSGCNCSMPEGMKDFLKNRYYLDNKEYYCFWCKFIRKTGISDLIVEENRKRSYESRYNEENEDFGAMRDLEDFGAFSDEGIMPGCHSGSWMFESEIESMNQEFEDLQFAGQCIKCSREKIGLYAEELAIKLYMPKSFIENIENGEYIKRYTIRFMPNPKIDWDISGFGKDDERKEVDKDKKWWENQSDNAIIEKVANYLSALFDKITSQRFLCN